MTADFRRQYDGLERQRAALAARLMSLGDNARKHPGHRRALVLINDTFRRSALARRRNVLDAADWLIGLLEQLTPSGQMARGFAAGKIRRMLPPHEKRILPARRIPLFRTP